MATPTPWLCIADEMVLTHHTFDSGKYLNAPRYEMGREISLISGRLSVEEASRYRRRLVTVKDLQMADVRHTSAGRLREEGFAVVHTPTRVTRGCGSVGEHVSVIWPDRDPIVHQDIPWPPEVTKSFTECFNGYDQNRR
ncbi:hypothetical protein ACFY19_26470 [Streptosporangium saharense]|uniref:hypothetical protein n=1 Tax=Streptosporangium saharense TaxID=1706840 RepID=UPI0036CB18CF